MNTVTVDTKVSIKGECEGVSGNAALHTDISHNRLAQMSQAGTGATLCNNALGNPLETVTLGVGTTTLNLQSFSNPLIESGQVFAKVRVIFFEHDSASLATSIVIFGSGANQFQGPLSAAGSVTLLPGEVYFARSATTAGWTVDGAHANIAIVVSGNTATLRYFIAGSNS